MHPNIGLLYFSATNTTQTICREIAHGMDIIPKFELNMIKPEVRKNFMNNPGFFLKEIDHLIIGAPVYSGKLPIPVIEFLANLKGEYQSCSAVVIYGNRDFGIALQQLTRILINNRFSITNAGAFIGQHTYSDIVPIATNRPDPSDLKIAYELGQKSKTKNHPISLKDIPVQIDRYSKSKKYTSLKPHFCETQCTKCGKCYKGCPLELIETKNGLFKTKGSRSRCIGCMACVSICKSNGRTLKANALIKIIMKKLLKQAALNRQEPITIIA